MNLVTEDAVQIRPAATSSPDPRATVIVVNYNAGERLICCLASLYDDPAATDYEVVIVDNASTDGSSEAVAARFPHVTILRNESNLGFGGANNLAARRAQGDVLAFLNPDTVVTSGWLESLIAALEADPVAALATSKILLLHQPERVNAAGNQIHLTGLTLCRGMGRPRSHLNTTEDAPAVSGAAFAIRRELFEEIGGFDASFFMYFEDTDLSLCARLRGYRCLYVPQSVVYHDYELRFGPAKTYYEERNRYRMLLKTFRWRTLILLLPALLLAEMVAWGYVLLRDRPRWRNKLRAYADVVESWPDIRHARQKAQVTRRAPDRELLRVTTHRIAFEQTGDGFVTRVAHLIFDPLFFLARQLVLYLVRW